MAEKLQYKGVCTSVPGYILKKQVSRKLRIYNRFMVTRKTDFSVFMNIVNFNSRLGNYHKGIYLVKSLAKRIIGNEAYQKLWEKFCKKM